MMIDWGYGSDEEGEKEEEEEEEGRLSRRLLTAPTGERGWLCLGWQQ